MLNLNNIKLLALIVHSFFHSFNPILSESKRSSHRLSLRSPKIYRNKVTEPKKETNLHHSQTFNETFPFFLINTKHNKFPTKSRFNSPISPMTNTSNFVLYLLNIKLAMLLTETMLVK